MKTTIPIADAREMQMYMATQEGEPKGKVMDAKECGQMNQKVKLGYHDKLPATYSMIQAETESENEPATTSHR